MTERLNFHFSLSCIGEGNGNPLQCSCLENPRDGGAWWAAVSGVAQSWTWLKRLSSSSSNQSICAESSQPLLSRCTATGFSLPKCLMACSQDGFIEPYGSHRPLHVPDQYQGFLLISLPGANPEPLPPTVVSPAKASVSWGHPPAPLYCVLFSCLHGAAWGWCHSCRSLELGTWRLYRFLSCAIHALSAVYHRETYPPVNTYTHSKSQFKGQLLRGALLGTIPLPFLRLLAYWKLFVIVWHN